MYLTGKKVTSELGPTILVRVRCIELCMLRDTAVLVEAWLNMHIFFSFSGFFASKLSCLDLCLSNYGTRFVLVLAFAGGTAPENIYFDRVAIPCR